MGTEPRIPLGLRLAVLLVPKAYRQEVLGDLLELWAEVRHARGRFGRLRWAWRQPVAVLADRVRHRPPRHEARGGTALLGGISVLDVKLGLRMLRKHPGLTVVSVLSMSMAVAFAAGFTAFSANVSGPPLPLDEGDRVVAVQLWDAAARAPEPRVLGAFASWAAGLTSIPELGAFKLSARNLVVGDRSVPVQGPEVTASTFRIARVPPLMGRVLMTEDDAWDAPKVAVLGFDLWKSLFGGDPDVLGKRIRLDGESFEVVGVMPRGFRFPYANDVWVPLREDGSRWEPLQGPAIFVFGRLADRASRAQALAEVIARTSDRTAARRSLRPRVLSYTSAFGVAPATVVFGGRAFLTLLLVVICASVGTLLTARNSTRSAELAIRAALGAGRRNVVMQLFSESLALTSVAGGSGLILTVLGLRAAERLAADQIFGTELPFWWRSGLTPNTVTYVIGFSLLGALVAGAIPALRATSGPLIPRLRRSQSGVGASSPLPRWAIPAQVAISIAAMTLVIGQIPHSLTREIDVPGLAAEEYLTAELRMGAGPRLSADPDSLLARYSAARRGLGDRLAASSEVDGVTFATALPGAIHRQQRVEVDGPTEPGRGLPVRLAGVDADFFRVMGVRPLRGRIFDSRDIARDGTARPVAVVNESFALERMGTDQVVGRRIRPVVHDSEPGPWLEIVGVVPDFGMNLDETDHPQGYYVPLTEQDYPVSVAVHRVPGAPGALPILRSAGIDADPALSLAEVRTAESIIVAARLRERVPFLGLAVPTLVALLLALGGTNALVSFAVAQRTREIGIRIALGARPEGVALEVVSRALTQVALGVAVGLSATVLLSRTIYAADDLRLVAWAGAVVIATGILACAAPARRAMGVLPSEAFRDVG